MAKQLILNVCSTPESMRALSLDQWDLLICQARQSNLLGRLAVMLQDTNLLESIPKEPREHFLWELNIVDRHAEAVSSEINYVTAALKKLKVPVILLKGAAYAAANLSAAKGRLFSDIDILVPKEKLGEVEAELMLHGWAPIKLDDYDQRYYRTWMHELPPMKHVRRLTVIDIHHAIVPDTSSFYPDPQKLRSAAKFVKSAGAFVLGPEDMVLHSAVHLFNDGEFDNGLRDLVDLDSLLKMHQKDDPFWQKLPARAIELELERPLFYALRFCKLLLNTPISEDAIRLANGGRPSKPMLMGMDFLLKRALMPKHISCRDAFTKPALVLLYIRGNWLRMPPLMLARHLFHKAFISSKSQEEFNI